MTGLRVKLLGGLRLTDGAGRPVTVSAKKARALLAYLAMPAGRSHTRDKLAALLWEDRDEAQARTSLRQALTALRRALPDNPAPLCTDGEEVSLNAADVDVDVTDFETLLVADAPDALERAATLYTGDLLDGFSCRAPAFEDWLRAERQRLREQALAALESLLDTLIAADRDDRAIAVASRLLALDPLRESVHRSVMRLHAGRGRQAAALKQYRVCRAALQRELDVTPEPATEALYREILHDRRLPQAVVPDPMFPAAPEEVDATATPSAVPVHDSELREATILCASLDDSGSADLDPEDIDEIQIRFSEVVDSIVRTYGGCIASHLGDTSMAVFGFPVAHGNDVERALRAALSIHRSLAERPVGPAPFPGARIGVASGRVITGGDTGRPVSGEPVTSAARLSQRAGGGETWVCGTVRRALGARLEGDGENDAWRVRGLSEETPLGDQPPMIGREAESRLFASLLDIVGTSGRGQAVVVRGEAGIGKSRLVETFARHAADRGIRTVIAPVYDFGGEAGLDAVRTLVEGLFGLPPGADDAVRRSAVDRAVGDGLVDDDRRMFLYGILGLDLPDDLVTLYGAMDNEARTRGRRDTVAGLFAATARTTPILLMVEDIHWADARLLSHLAAIGGLLAELPSILVLTTRADGDPLDAAWRAAAGGCPIATIDLAPLTEAEALQLAAQYDLADDPFGRACVARAGGNPLFLNHLLRHPDQREGSAPPGTIQSLVLARLDRLEIADRRALEAASVLGIRFGLEAVRELVDDPAYDPRMPLQHALIRPDGDDYLFAHALIRDGVYASLPRRRRHRLHRRAADWYGARQATLRAEHLCLAADPEAAAACLDASREQAAAYRFEQALQLIEGGLEATPDDALHHALCSLRGNVLHQLGRFAAAIDAFAEALPFAQSPAQRIAVRLGMIDAMRIIGRHDEALAGLAEAESEIGDQPDDEALATIHYLRGGIHFPRGEIDACLQDHESALRHARAAKSVEREANALSGLGDAYYLQGRMDTAFRYFDDCLRLSQSHRLPRAEVCNLPMRGIIRFFQGDLDGAFEDCAAALSLAQAVGDERGAMLSRNVVSWMHLEQKAWDEALHEADETRRLAESIGARVFVPETHCIHAHALLCMGERAAAAERMRQTYPLAEQTGSTYTGAVVLGLLALATDDAGERAKALADGEALLARGCVSHNYFYFYRYGMDAALADGDWDLTDRFATALADYTRREPLNWTAAFIERGRRLAAAGRAGQAIDAGLPAALIDLVETDGLSG